MNAVTEEALDFDPFAAGGVERVVPTSEAQREVWLADKLSPQASLAFNESVNLRLIGAVDEVALRGALDALLLRHESLRSTLSPDGTELLVGAALGFDLDLVDLRAFDEADRHRALADAARGEVDTPFDLERGPLLRGTLYWLGDGDRVLMLTAHHIVCDGWSWGVIAEDLGALYAELLGSAPTPDAAVQYSEYVQWEVAEAQGPDHAGHEAFWLGRFKGSLPVLDLPTDRPRLPSRTFSSHRIDHVLDAGLVTQVRKLGAGSGASLFATLFCGFAATLSRLTQQDDLVIGVPAAGQSASGMTSLVGHCVNLLPVRVAIDGQKAFDEVLRHTAGTLLDAFEHQTLTFGSLLKKLPLARDPSRLPLVSVMFNVDQAVKSRIDAFPGLMVELAANPRRFENFEVFVNAAQVDGALRLECQYNSDLFDERTMRRWLGAYEALLQSAVRDPATAVARLTWFAAGEWGALQALQPTPTPLPEPALMHAAVLRQAAATPARVALRHGKDSLSYLELDRRSTQLARALRARGLGEGARVGLCLARGIDMVVALLAALKAGATYVPLDPSFPPARLNYYAEDAKLALLLTDSSVSTAPTDWAPDAAQRTLVIDVDIGWLREPDQALVPSNRDATPETAAYIIYTSGSTGQPKGVCVPHRAVANFLASMQREPGLQAEDVLAAVTTLSFDIAVLELMLPLNVGAAVVIVPRDAAMDGNLLRALLDDVGATAMQATPSMWRLLLEADWRGRPGFKALVGGEGLPPDLASGLLDRCSELWNMYGPTETTIWSTLWRVDRQVVAERGVSIGRPIDNTSVWVLDDERQPCPVGVPGEICIGGAGVALGYLDRPELTAERFIADGEHASDGARLYRTGDRGRWRNDGLLEHLGRLDFQVKVRGYRIELGEIEAACNAVDGVAQSVVLAREDRPGDVRIVAYLVAATGTSVDAGSLRDALRARLPDYMLPQQVVTLDALPLLPNGKIDRKALPAPEASRTPAQVERVAARNDTEREVLGLMESVLNLPSLGVTDDFFALGGHSLLAARLTSKLNRLFDLSLPLSTLFASPTAARLAAAIEKARTSTLPRRKPIVADPGRSSAPLTPMQERICFVQELHPDRVLYNTPSAHRLIGPMDLALFDQALREVVARQPSLRTRIAVDEAGAHLQSIAPTIDFDLPVIDLSALPAAERETELLRQMQAIVDTPMDIREGPLFRAALYRLEAEEHAFLFMPHHVIWDGWSFDLLYDEMAAAYGALRAGRSNPLPALPVSYGDYAEWYAQWMTGPEYAEQLEFWKRRFEASPMPVALHPDHPRRAGMTGEGATEWVRIDRHLTERLRVLARSADATLNMLTMAIYAAMMASIADHSSIVIGVPVRGRLMAEVEPVMGFFNNLLPVNLPVRRDLAFVDFVRAIKRELMEVMTYQDIPFERVAAEPEVAARMQRAGLYQALFSFQDARERKRDWGGLSQSAILIFQKGATEDLGLWLMEVPSGLEGGFTYNADLYKAETAAAFRERFLELLSRAVADENLSVEHLLAEDGSSAAQRLRHLAHRDPLPSTQPAAPAGPAARQAPSTGAAPVASTYDSAEERTLAGLWAELLGIGVEQIQPTDNFFDLGGDSLLAMRAVEQSARALGFRVEARRYVFESLAQLASPMVATATAGKVAAPAAKGRGLLGGVLAAFGRKPRS